MRIETKIGTTTETETETMTETETETMTKKKTRGKKKKGMLISVSELEALLGVHRRTIGRWIENGKFPHPFKIDKTKYWTRKQLAACFREKGIPVF